MRQNDSQRQPNRFVAIDRRLQKSVRSTSSLKWAIGPAARVLTW